jgi:hypothetical protein
MEQWIGKSFEEIEKEIWEKLIETFQQAMAEILSKMDESLMATRDTERYQYKEKKEKTWMSLVGPLTIRRRYYRDRETGEWVFLLDESLGIRGRGSISGGLMELSVLWGTRGPSYRDARDRLKEIYGSQVISHEKIRQLVIGSAEKLRSEEVVEQREKPEVLYIEADGFWNGMQGRRKAETKLVVVHEGWEKRQGKEKPDFRLKGPMYVTSGELEAGEEIWERVYEQMVRRYGKLGTIPVVINGDYASWIRAGAETFPGGMYQVDRFHLKREVRMLLSKDRSRMHKALGHIDGNDPQKLQEVLLEAVLCDHKSEEIMKFRERVLMGTEALRDYRVRLKEQGIEVSGLMRGMGSAESSVDRFKLRTAKRGRGWSKKGLSSVLFLLGLWYEGKLLGRLQQMGQSCANETEVIPDIFVRQIAKTIGKGKIPVHRGQFPATRNGTQGYAKTFRQLLQVEPI